MDVKWSMQLRNTTCKRRLLTMKNENGVWLANSQDITTAVIGAA
ncbi:hypothetical protein ABH966_002670 [Lysinibacillus sp. RC46]